MDIKKHQNKKDILTLLFSAKIHYNRAEIINYLIWVVSFLSGYIGISNYKFIADNRNLILLILVALSLIFHKYIYDLISIGSKTKELIDLTLFGFSENSIKDNKNEVKTIALKLENHRKYHLLTTNDGNSEAKGVKDWYNPESSDKLKSIFQCQKENFYWDKELSKIYKKFLYLMIIIVFTYLGLTCYNNSNNLLLILYSFSSLIILVGRELIGLNNYNLNSARIDELINSIEPEIVETLIPKLMRFQELIFKRRKLFFIIPNILHKFKSKELHRIWNALN